MAFRITSCKALFKTLSATSKAPAALKNIPTLNSRLLYKSYRPGLHYTQSRGIFWGEKKPKQDQDGTEKPVEEAQAKTDKNEETKRKVESESEDEVETKKTEKKPSEQQESAKTEEEPAQQRAQTQKTAEPPKKPKMKEETVPETFENLLQNPTPENQKKIHALYSKLEKELQEKAKELQKTKSVYNALEKAAEDHNKKIDELRRRLKEEVDERELMRKRTDKEVEQTKVFAISKFAKDLIDVPDNLGRALDAAKGLEGKDDPLYDGVKSTYNILLKVFAKNGVTQINPINEKFNPNYHEALFDVQDPNARPGTCGFVANVGYLINDRVLRPAKVGVVKGVYVETESEKQAKKDAEAK